MCKSSLYLNKAMLHQACLASAFRTSLACTIVGLTTLFGPTPINNIIAFPALSYLTAILIIRDATLGETLRGCWLALCATIQSTVPAMLGFWCIGPAAKFFSEGTTVFAVALAAFVVVLPAESTTHLMAKRLALGQIVVLYVVAYVREEVRRELLMHPLRVAASTALGVLACVLAMLFPYPRLAYHQVKKNYRLLTNNTSKRLKLLMKAICEQKKDLALTSISHAKSLATSRNKLLQILTNHQNGMRWEIPPIKSFRSYHFNPEDQKLQDIDTTIKGMELALTSIISFPVSILNEDMKHGLNSLVKHVSLTIKQTTHNSHGPSLTAPEHSEKNRTNFLQSLQTIPTTQDLPFYFYLFCAKILQRISYAEAPTSIQEKEENSIESQNWAKLLTSPKLMESMKCSLTLGLAVLLGLLYSKENGFWAAIPVAVTFSPGREATFRVANIKAQGTVLGTVYGVLCCFVFEKFLSLRFMFLIPWLIFTTVLQQSKMYGAAGGMSAQIGAILILGRKNFGPPSEFAIARIIETFIGLTCSVLVHLLFMPKRASTCAKSELSFCLGTLVESINSLSLASKSDLEESHRKLKMQIMELKKFVVEAELEPCFWFLPFHGACYNKLMGSLSILDNTLQVGAYALKFLKQEFRRSEASWREHVSVLEGEIGYFKEHVSSKVKVFEQITRMKSFGFLEKELEKNSITCNCDIEMGRSAKSGICMFSSGLGHGDVAEEVIGSYLQCSRNVVDELYGGEGEKEVKSDVYLCLSALGFCLSILLRETMEIEEAIRELVQWENPSKGD